MCGVDDIILLASIAATVGGTAASVAGQEKAKRAMNNATNLELMRQRGIQDKSSAEFAQSLAQSLQPVANKQMQEGETEKLQGYEQAQAVPINVGNQQLVGGQNAALNLQDNAQRSLSNRSRAKLGSYEKWQLDQAIKNLRSAQQQSLFNQEAQRSQAVHSLELQDASHRGDSLKALGTGLGAVGALLSLGSLAGVGAGGASSALTTPQLAAFNTGFGPVSAGYASSIYGSTAPLFASQQAVNLANNTSQLSNLFSLGSTVGNSLYGLNRKY